jgi:S1-C subfamily serine protease
VAAFADGFDEFSDEDPLPRPLPAEDRLWRHPSELGSLGVSLPLDPITVRRRWLASQPSRASAWTAGLVGALLATGLVALGTHLASAITAHTATGAADLSARASAAASGLARDPVPDTPTAIGSTLAANMAAAGRSLLYVDVVRDGVEIRTLGVGVGANGMVLAPAASLAGATRIVVALPGGVLHDASIVGQDFAARAASSGLALVHVDGVSNMAVARLSTERFAARDSLTVAVSAPGGRRFSFGSIVTSAQSAPANGTVLVDAMPTDLTVSDAPMGSMLLGADGQVLGIVTGTSSGRAVATPAWIASEVASRLASVGTVLHGWLGIEGTTAAPPQSGVEVGTVTTPSAASAAGLRRGDVIVSVGRHRVSTMAQLQGLLYLTHPGQRLSLGVVRHGHHAVVTTVLEGDERGQP